MRRKRILIIADSVCGGFGQKDKKSFVHFSLDTLNIEYIDQSATGMTTTDYLNYLKTGKPICKEQASLIIDKTEISFVILSLGNVDTKSQYAKNNFMSRLVPKRYKKEKIDPRPYFSKSLLKKTLQKIENYIRFLFRFYSFISGNYTEATSFKKYKVNILEIMQVYSDCKIILVGVSTINDNLFFGTENRFLEVEKFLYSLENDEKISFFSYREFLNRNDLLEDQFHLNAAGHIKIAGDFTIFLKGLLR